MVRRRFTLRSSHLLMWSSPLLLLVLVFTLNSRPLHPVTSTTTAKTTTSRAPSVTSTTTTTTTTITSKPPATTTTANLAVTTTTAARAHSSNSTTTSVAATALASGENRAGALTLAFPEAVVPLHGPGQWSLNATHAIASELICGSHSLAVTTLAELGSNQSCQLAITVATGAPTTWTLRAVR